MLGLLTVGLPQRAVALALAAVVLATTLAVVPVPASVPLVGDGSESASAHVQRQCETYQTLSCTSRQARLNGSQPVWITRTRCWSVPHTHRSWQPWVLGGIAVMGCGAIGVASAPAGFIRGAQVTAATIMSGN